MADSGECTQGTRDRLLVERHQHQPTNQVQKTSKVRHCRQTSLGVKKDNCWIYWFSKNFLTLALVALLWFETCQNLVATANCVAESKEKM